MNWIEPAYFRHELQTNYSTLLCFELLNICKGYKSHCMWFLWPKRESETWNLWLIEIGQLVLLGSLASKNTNLMELIYMNRIVIFISKSMWYNNWLQCTVRQRTLTNGHSQAVKRLFHVVSYRFLCTTHIHIKKLFNMNEHKLKIKILFVTLRVTLTWISITLAFYDDLPLIF